MRESACQQQEEEQLFHGSLDTTIAACAVCIDSPGERGQVELSRRKRLVPGTRPPEVNLAPLAGRIQESRPMPPQT